MMRSTFFASSTSVTSIVVDDTMVDSADSTATFAATNASRTSYSSDGSQVIFQNSPSAATSSAPASRAAIITSSSPPLARMTPLRLNCQLTAPGSANEPPSFENTLRTSALDRLRLSVSTSMSSATPPGAYPS